MEEKTIKAPITSEEVANMTSEEIAKALNDKDAALDELEKSRNSYKGLYEYESRKYEEAMTELKKSETMLKVIETIALNLNKQ